MKAEALFVAIVLVCSAFGQPRSTPAAPSPVSDAASSVTSAQNLPGQAIGPDDLLAVSVYDSPELTRTVRVATDGSIRIPLLKHKLDVGGMSPAEVESSIAKALNEGGILVDPVVSVAVVEYRSRPINVVGAVRTPITFQALPNTHLLDAITRAQGLTDDAGQDIIVTHTVVGEDGKATVINQRILAKSLLTDADSDVNIALVGGEEVRVPQAGRIFVVGDVRRPGAINVHETNGTTTVLKALALSQGLDRYPSRVAYIFRKEGSPNQDGIPVQLSKILARKAPDVALQPNDILYIPDDKGRRVTMEALERTLGLGTAATAAAIYAIH